MGNTMTAEVAKLALENYGLGSDNITDFLAVSFFITRLRRPPPVDPTLLKQKTPF